MKKKLLNEQLTALEKLINRGQVEEAEKQAMKALKDTIVILKSSEFLEGLCQKATDKGD